MARISNTIAEPDKLKASKHYLVSVSEAPASASSSWSITAIPDQPSPHLVIANNRQNLPAELMLVNNTERSVRFTVVASNSCSSFTISPNQSASQYIQEYSVSLVFVEASLS